MRGTPRSLWLSMANRWAATGVSYWSAIAGEALLQGSRDRRRAARRDNRRDNRRGTRLLLPAKGKDRTGPR